MRKVDYEKWHELLERYFDAQTTDEEELSLRRFLSSPEAVGNEFDEARAVMGFLCVGKEKRLERQRSLWRKSAWMSVAAGVALLFRRSNHRRGGNIVAAVFVFAGGGWERVRRSQSRYGFPLRW
jgi:hypothetical protein